MKKFLMYSLPLLISGIALSIYSRKSPRNLGIKDGKLFYCPDSPNCVSSQAENEKFRLDPIPFINDSFEESKEKLLEVIDSMPDSQIITMGKYYVYSVFKTKLFRFIDDVEFHLDDENKVIHFRSSSRVGYSDLGVNRKRMEELRKRFLEN